MLILKITNHNCKTRGGRFQWPKSGPVECSDWDPTPRCGGGLHGWAEGQGAYRHTFNLGVFMVVEVDDASVVMLSDGAKCKFPKGNVVYSGTREGAVEVLKERGVLNETSNPAWACLTPDQCVTVALKSADRAVRRYAPVRLHNIGRSDLASKLSSLPEIVDGKSAREARTTVYAVYAASYVANADAVAYAANAVADADAAAAANAAAYANYAYAAATAANAGSSADAAYAAATAADYANYAYAVAYAATAAAADAADAADAERELCRLDKLRALGIIE